MAVRTKGGAHRAAERGDLDSIRTYAHMLTMRDQRNRTGYQCTIPSHPISVTLGCCCWTSGCGKFNTGVSATR